MSHFSKTWEQLYFIKEVKDRKCKCMICNKVFKGLILSNIKRHFKIIHNDYYILSVSEKQELFKKKESEFNDKRDEECGPDEETSRELIKGASYLLAYNIARHKRPMSDGDFLKKPIYKTLYDFAIAYKNNPNMKLTQRELRELAPYICIKPEKYADAILNSSQSQPIFINDLINFSLDTGNLHTLLLETVDILKSVTKSSYGCLYFIDPASNEIYIHQGDSDMAEKKKSWKIRTGSTVAAHVAHEKEYAIVNNLSEDERFPQGTCVRGVSEAAVMCIPVVKEDECFAVVELIRQFGEPYETCNLQIVVAVAGWMGAAIHQRDLKIDFKKRDDIRTHLLLIFQKYFGHNIAVENVLTEIVNYAKGLLHAEHGSFYILDRDDSNLWAECYDESLHHTNSSEMLLKKFKIKLNRDRGIAGLAVKTREIINVSDAMKHPYFDHEIDKKIGIVPNSMLCVPIENPTAVVGVMQLINKTNEESCYSKNDENLIKPIGTCCSMAFHYKQLGEKNKNIILYNELLDDMYFYQVTRDYAETLVNKVITIPADFEDLMWYPYPHHIDIMLPLAHYMLKKIGEGRLSNIEKFIFAIQNCYRAQPYHNFEHAFNVMHSIFCMLMRNFDNFSYIERVALCVAAICHDVDHRSVTNMYYQHIQHSIWKLYDYYPLENHHIWVGTMMINNVQLFEKFTTEEFNEVMLIFRKNIAATDLMQHLVERSKLMNLICQDRFDWNNKVHRFMGRALMMTTADLSGQAKPYEVVKRLTSRVYDEFYAQGDKEKLLGLTPIPMMNRLQLDSVPDDQMKFLNFVCIPCFDMVDNLLRDCSDILRACVRRRRDRSVSRFSVAMGNSTMMSGGQGRKTIINPMTITRNALRVLQPYIWRKQDKRKDIDELNFQNKPSILMRDVTMVMSDNVSLPQLFRETSNILKSVTNSTGVMLYLVDSGANEIYLCPQNPENRSEQRISWKIQMGYSVAAHVAHEKEIICVNNLVKDDRFPSGLSWKGRTEAAVLCAPVVTGDDECFAIIELFRATNGPYENRHFQIVAAVTGWMGTAINENNRRVLYQKKEELNSCLQEIVQKYFGETIEVENLLVDIVRFAKSTLSADRGSFFVLDPDSQELGAECFDDTTPLNCNIDHFLAQKKKLKIRLNKEKGIAGLAASTGQIVNIKDAFNDPRFSREVDQKTGIITRSALCLPVEGKGGIVGVLQLMNKTNSESCFSKNDETLIRTFGVYCTIALHYKQVKENVEKSMLYNELYDEMYFHQISKNCPTFHEDVFPENFDDLMWYPEQDFIDDGNMLPCAIKMLKLIGNNRLHNVELFVHATSRAYRALPFHNFEFGFNVTHAIYCILTRNPTKFTHTERVALMIAGLCRAVDHRGVTSSYLKRTNHLLKRLYGHFIMPSHHVWVSKIIIKHTQLLKNYSKEEYSEIMSSYEDITLSTGSYSYSHIKYIHILNSITEANAFDWSNRKHRSFASKLLLKSAAISFKAKPYNIAMRLISNLYQEIYAQGDKERLIGQTPSDLIDRNKADKIPENEVNIINHFCIPCLELLDQIFVNVTDMLQASLQFRENWMHVIMHRGKRMWSPLEYNAKEETEEKKGKKFEATREDIDNLMFTSI